MDKTAVISKLRDYVMLLKDKGYDIRIAFLYGSYSKGQEKEDSDIDVLLVTGDKTDLDDEAKGKLWALTLQVDSRIEPYVVSAERFAEDDISPLIQIVKKEGIEIAC